MKVPYTVIKPTEKKDQEKKTHGNICRVLKSAGKVCTAFSSSHSHPSTISLPDFKSLNVKNTKPQRLLPFPLTQHRSQHRVGLEEEGMCGEVVVVRIEFRVADEVTTGLILELDDDVVRKLVLCGWW